MLNLKKTAVAVLAFGSSAVFAGTMGPVCTPGSVTVPCESTAWDFAGYALYLQPSFSGDGEFVGSTATTNSTGGITTSYQRRQPNWGWGFKLEGSYHFGTGNDIDLNWYHMNNSRSRTLTTTALPLTSFDAFTSNNPTLKVSPRWDAVNLEFGQHADFGDMYNVRFHGDIAYFGLHNKDSITSNTVAGTTTAGLYSYASRTGSYNSVGPRVGADLSYDWGNGLGIYANGATALFVGTKSFNASQTLFTGAVNTQTGSVTSIVPEVEGKLGAMYTYAMSQGDLSLDVGWMWINYFHAERNDSDFGLQGLYFGLKWLGNFV